MSRDQMFPGIPLASAPTALSLQTEMLKKHQIPPQVAISKPAFVISY